MNEQACDGLAFVIVMASFFITIAIPTYNRATWLVRTLDSIAQLVIPSGVGVELLVVDNASTDGTAKAAEEMAGRFPFPLRVVQENQQGLCHGRNRALREAGGQHVAFFDDDVLVAPTWMVGYCDAVARFNAEAVVGPVYPLFEIPPPPHYSELVLDSVTSAYSRKGEEAKQLPPDVAHQIPGCNFGVRRETALAVGGFDSHLDRIGAGMVGHGDWEFGYALVRAGKRVAYEPRCRVDHSVGAGKLQPASLRARWFGFGAAERFLAARHGKRVPGWASAKSATRAARYVVMSLLKRINGDPRTAFELQLRACREWGYARGLKT